MLEGMFHKALLSVNLKFMFFKIRRCSIQRNTFQNPGTDVTAVDVRWLNSSPRCAFYKQDIASVCEILSLHSTCAFYLIKIFCKVAC